MAPRGLIRFPYNPSSFWRVCFRWRGSIVKSIAIHVFFVIIIAVIVACLYEFDVFKDYHGDPMLSDGAHRQLVIPLSFLLIFRSNIAYSRYWEGRGVVSDFIRKPRELVRLSMNQIRGEDAKGKWYRYNIARMSVLLIGLICDQVSDKNMEWDYACMTKEEKYALEDEDPTLLISLFAARIGAIFGEAYKAHRIEAPQVITLDNRLKETIDAWSSAMKIVDTPMPFPYVQMLNVFLIVFVYTLPFMLVHDFGWATPAVAGILCAAFFGINAVGVELEDPFGVDDNDFNLEHVEFTVHQDSTALLLERDPEVTPVLPRKSRVPDDFQEDDRRKSIDNKQFFWSLDAKIKAGHPKGRSGLHGIDASSELESNPDMNGDVNGDVKSTGDESDVYESPQWTPAT